MHQVDTPLQRLILEHALALAKGLEAAAGAATRLGLLKEAAVGYLESVGDVVAGLSIREWSWGVLVALAAALITAGLFALLRRRVADATMLLCLLVIPASVASMALAAGYIAFARGGGASPPGGGPSGGLAPEDAPRRSAGLRFLVAADIDRDGRLTPEEAARLVRDADVAGKGWVAAQELDYMLSVLAAPPLPESAATRAADPPEKGEAGRAPAADPPGP